MYYVLQAEDVILKVYGNNKNDLKQTNGPTYTINNNINNITKKSSRSLPVPREHCPTFSWEIVSPNRGHKIYQTSQQSTYSGSAAKILNYRYKKYFC